MTEPRDVDDRASALLDGLLPAAEADAARRDPAVARRADEMRAARNALRQVPPADATRREAALAAALDALDPFGLDPHDLDAPDAADAARPAPPPAPVSPAAASTGPTPLVGSAGAARPAGGRRRAWRDPRWLAAAAVAVLVLAVGGLLATGSSPSDDENAADVSSSSPAAGSGGSESGSASEESDTGTAMEAAPEGGDRATQAAPDADDGAGPSSADPPAAAARRQVDLGSVASADQLADRARGATASTALDTLGDDEQSETFSAEGTCADPEGGAAPVVLHARARLAGEQVTVWVHDRDGARNLVAVDGSCRVVVDRPLDG
jgi:hypothetical protein